MLVFDECMPRPLRRDLPDWDVRTVRELGLDSFRNGDLLRALPSECEAFITVDRALRDQQNVPKLPFAVVLMTARGNRLEDLLPLIPELRGALTRIQPGVLFVVGEA